MSFIINSYRFGAAAFVESETPPLTGMVEWHRADDITGVDPDAVITTWVDSSGNGFDVTQSNGSNKPILKTNFINGRNAVHFVDSSDSMARITTPALSQPYTYVALSRLDTASGFDKHIIQSGGAGNRGFLYHEFNAGITDERVVMWAGTDLEGAVEVLATWQIYEGSFNGASSVLYQNGLIDASGDANTGGHAGTVLGSAFANGYMAEVMIYDHLLDEAERNQLIGYLAPRYNIEAYQRHSEPTGGGIICPPHTELISGWCLARYGS